MRLNDFEQEIKKIDPNLRIVPHPSNDDMAGVYYQDMFVCGCPSNDIFPERKEGYTNKLGYPHVTTVHVTAKIHSFIHKLRNEEGFYELMTEKYENPTPEQA